MKLLRQPFLGVVILASSWNSIAATTADLVDITQPENHIIPSLAVQGEPVPKMRLPIRMAQAHIPGMSIAVVKDGRLVYAKGFGIAHENGRKVDEHTLFQAGSISKPVAALAAMQLVEAGKIDLDADVNQYLKGWQIDYGADAQELAQASPAVTLRQLLTHTSGLTVHGFPGYATGSDVPTTLGVLQGKGNTAVVRLDQTPGAHWRYSGGGYTVMQKLVEDITGQNFADYADKHILLPMGMTSSTYQHSLPPTLKARASGAFDSQGKMYSLVYHDYPEKAAAGLWTTPRDLAQYVRHMQQIMQGKVDGVVSKTTLEQVFSKHQNQWGLGPELSGQGPQLIFRHGGKNLGFTNYFLAHVYQGNGIIVMGNGDNGNDLNLDTYISLSTFYQLALAEQQLITPIHLDEAQLERLVGKYKMRTDIGFNGDFIAEITVANGKVWLSVPTDDALSRLVPTATHTLTSSVTGNTFVFSYNDKGEVTGIVVSGRFELDKL